MVCDTRSVPNQQLTEINFRCIRVERNEPLRTALQARVTRRMNIRVQVPLCGLPSTATHLSKLAYRFPQEIASNQLTAFSLFFVKYFRESRRGERCWFRNHAPSPPPVSETGNRGLVARAFCRYPEIIVAARHIRCERIERHGTPRCPFGDLRAPNVHGTPRCPFGDLRAPNVRHEDGSSSLDRRRASTPN